MDSLSYIWQRSGSDTYRKWFIFHTMWPPPDEKPHFTMEVFFFCVSSACLLPLTVGQRGKLRVIIITVGKCWQPYIAEPVVVAKRVAGRHRNSHLFIREALQRLTSPHVWTVVLLCVPYISSLWAWPHYPFMWLMLVLSLVAWHGHGNIIAYKLF